MKKIFAVVFAVIFFAARTAVSFAAGTGIAPDKYDEMIQAAIEDNMRERGADSFFDGLEFGKADWTALCYARLYGADGAEKYIADIKSSVKELYNSDSFVRPTEYQRASVVLSALGDRTDEARELAGAAAFYNRELDRQGLNAWLWALIAANCFGDEPEDALNIKETLAEHILEKQLADGGFTLMGSGADCDITAAAIYALAPLSGENDKLDKALDRAVERLSQLRLESGGFYSMGTENCESTAQAVIAFTAVGYDISDERVSAALGAMLSYRNNDGGFAHIPGGKSNAAATAQALEALTAVILSQKGERLFDKAPDNSESGQTSDVKAPDTSDPSETSLPEKNTSDGGLNTTGGGLSGFDITLIISAVSGALALAMLIAALLKKKAFFLPAALFAVISAGIWFADIRSPEEYYAKESGHEIAVTVAVSCESALLNMDKINEDINPASVIPDNGVIIPEAATGLDRDATAFDALTAAARDARVRVDYIGSAYGLYVTAIGDIYEYGFGENSGWIYRVNGMIPDRSCGEYVLSDGDTVEFLYTCDLGRDIAGFDDPA